MHLYNSGKTGASELTRSRQDRLTGKHVDLTAVPFSELPLLQTRLGVTFSPGTVTEVAHAEPFVLLSDVLARFPHLAISLVRLWECSF